MSIQTMGVSKLNDIDEVKNRTCGFTGHRRLPKTDAARIAAELERVILELAAKGYNRFLCGGALGFDTLAARAVLRHRERNPAVKPVIVQPCRDQPSKWRETDRRAYYEILDSADEVICLSENYYVGCMQTRNRYIVDNSGVCVAFCRRASSGTGYTVKYAKSKGVAVINLSEHISPDAANSRIVEGSDIL